MSSPHKDGWNEELCVKATRDRTAASGHGLPLSATLTPLHDLFRQLAEEVERQDEKHGPFEGTDLGRSRLALGCLEDEVEEAKQAWRVERKTPTWEQSREEVLQVAAVAIRALRDAL